MKRGPALASMLASMAIAGAEVAQQLQVPTTPAEPLIRFAVR